MALRVSVDEAACRGYANCLLNGLNLFDFDEETNKAVVVGDGTVGETYRPEAEAAQRGCPASAIHIEGA